MAGHEFEQNLEKFGGKLHVVSYEVNADGSRGEPLKSWEPTKKAVAKVFLKKIFGFGRAKFTYADSQTESK